MAHNPYRTPRSVVRDAAPVPRPAQVTLACRILWVVFFLSLVTLHPDIRGDWWHITPDETISEAGIPDSEDADDEVEPIVPAFVIGMTVAFAAAYALLVWSTGRGHNWARWALLAFVCATTAMGAVDFGRSFTETPLALLADACFTVAEIWAFSLLFFGAGAAWFSSGDA